MCLKLSGHQPNRVLYTQAIIYEPHDNHKPKSGNRYTKRKKIKESKHNNTKKNHQSKGKRAKEKGAENYKNNLKTINKTAISTYVPITLNVNGLNAQSKDKR